MSPQCGIPTSLCRKTADCSVLVLETTSCSKRLPARCRCGVANEHPASKKIPRICGQANVSSPPSHRSHRAAACKKDLTRRANHRHSFIIVRISTTRAGNRPRAFFVSDFLKRTVAARHDATPTHGRLSVASAPPSELLLFECDWPACANVPARGVGKSTFAGGPLQEDKVRV